MNTTDSQPNTLKPRTYFDIAVSVGMGLLLLVGIGCIVYEIVLQSGHHIHYKGETGRLQRDSARLAKNVDKLSGQIGQMESFAYRFRAQRDSAFSAGKLLRKGMTYLQKKSAFLQGLADKMGVDYRDRPEEAPDSVVVDAGLQVVDQERILTVLSDSLARSIAARDIRIERMKKRDERKDRKISKLIVNTEAKKAGGVWPFNAKRRKQLNAVVKEQKAVLVDEESDLERYENH